MKWQDYKDEFEFDGSWRDIYVLTTDVSDWQLLVDFIHSSVYKYSYAVSGEKAELPLSAEEIFKAAYELRPFVSLNIGSITLNCHFFTDEEIEFDLDPREIRDEHQAEQVFTFMRLLSQLLDKEVILTPENMQDIPIFKFIPSVGKIQYIPCSN